jgi:hypothetical protein
MEQTEAAHRVLIEVINIFVLIKAFALADRVKEKDSYDIAFILHHYQPTLTDLAIRLAPLLDSGPGAEAYRILTEKFATLESAGPSWAGQIASENGQNLQQAQQAALQDAQELFDEVRRIQSQQVESTDH